MITYNVKVITYNFNIIIFYSIRVMTITYDLTLSKQLKKQALKWTYLMVRDEVMKNIITLSDSEKTISTC